MSRSFVRALSVLVLPLVAWACSDHDPAAPANEQSEQELEIDIVRGYGQYGRTGMYFPEHLVVMVTGEDGQAVEGVPVQWSVVDGPLKVSDETTLTNRFGRAKITAYGETRLGEGSIRARIGSGQEQEALFRETVSAFQVVMKSDQYKEMTFSSELVVEVGDTIEWLNKDMTDTGGTEHYMHSATSIVHPAGGESFDSPMLKFDETFRWVPHTTGRWEYECKDHPQAESMYGTIKVVERK